MKIRPPKKILLFNVNWVGDVLFSTAALKSLKEAFPDSFISCVIPPRCYAVLENNPHLNEIIVFDEKKEYRGFSGVWRFSRLLAGKKFDTVFLLHRSFSRALIAVLAGIKQRIGYTTLKRFFLLTCQGPAPAVTSVHRIDYYLGVLKLAGIVPSAAEPEMFIGSDDLRQAEVFLRSHLSAGKRPPLIGINPGGNWALKRWGIEAFTELALRCRSEFNAVIVVTGGQEDVPLANAVRSRVSVIATAGVFTLKQFAAFSRSLDVFVTADSGPLHIANAAGCRRIIALFGPTDPALTGPRPGQRVTVLQKKTECKVPCYRVDCTNNRCMQAITVEDVLAAMRPYVCSR